MLRVLKKGFKHIPEKILKTELTSVWKCDKKPGTF
jgi:hypothetical protein